MKSPNATLKWCLLLLCGLTMVMATACGGGDLEDDGVPAARGTTVKIANFKFSPQTIEISPGTKVTWINRDKSDHTVTANNGDFDELLEPGEKFSFTFEKSGTFRYNDRLHKQPGLVGTVKVD